MKSEKTSIKRFAPLLIILAVLVALVAIITPVVAYYIRTTGEVGGDYTAAKPADPDKPSFTLSGEQSEISNVTITVPDEGYPVFVRATIIFTWKLQTDDDRNGDVFFGDLGGPQPGDGGSQSDGDYTFTLGDKWKQQDAYFYYTEYVESGETIKDSLIKSCKLCGTPPADCVLSVEIIVQTVQAIGSTDKTDENPEEIPAWEDAWKNW